MYECMYIYIYIYAYTYITNIEAILIYINIEKFNL